MAYNVAMISCILLSAGLSVRFKSPKALAPIADTPAITFILKKLCASKIMNIIIVLGADKELILPCLFKHKIIQVVYNNDYKLGQTSSVQTGLKNLSPRSQGFMILPVDCPFITIETINSLIEYFNAHQPDILIPKYGAFKGHPPVFKAEFQNIILKLPHTQGLNTILQNPIYKVETLGLPDPGIRQTFNTPEELTQILNAKKLG